MTGVPPHVNGSRAHALQAARDSLSLLEKALRSGDERDLRQAAQVVYDAQALQLFDALAQFRRDLMAATSRSATTSVLVDLWSADWNGEDLEEHRAHGETLADCLEFDAQYGALAVALRNLDWTRLGDRAKGLWRIGMSQLEGARRQNLEDIEHLLTGPRGGEGGGS